MKENFSIKPGVIGSIAKDFTGIGSGGSNIGAGSGNIEHGAGSGGLTKELTCGSATKDHEVW